MERQGPKVIPVKDPEFQNDKHDDLHPYLPQISGYGGGALVLLLSPVKTGKSTIINNLLLNKDFYDAQERFDGTYIISNTIANDITSRFLKRAFETHDHYSDTIIDGIVERQKSYPKEEQPEIALILDDCLGSIKREARVNHLASRYRHYNIKLLIMSSQKFTGSVSPVVRANATNVIIGSPFPNMKELSRICEEYGDMFGSPDKMLALYKAGTPERYDFIHLDLQSNPPKMYKNFDTLIAEGERNLIPINKKFSTKEENIVIE